MISKMFDPKVLEARDLMIMDHETFEVVSIGAKTWGKFPVNVIYRLVKKPVSPLCPCKEKTVNYHTSLNIDPTYNAYSIRAIYRKGEKMWEEANDPTD